MATKFTKSIFFILTLTVLNIVRGEKAASMVEPCDYNGRIRQSFAEVMQPNDASFIVYFYNIFPCLIYKSTSDKTLVRQLVFWNDYIPIKQEIGLIRFTQPVTQVYIISISAPNQVSLQAFVTFIPPAIRPFSVFLFIDELKESFHVTEAMFYILYLNFPALKVVMQVNNPDETNEYLLICNGYCKPSQNHFSKAFLQKLLMHPLKLHKHNFWNSNKRQLTAVIYTKLILFFKNYPSPSQRNQCPDLLRKRSNNSVFCESELMAINTIGNVHNISFEIFHKYADYEEVANFDVSKNSQLIRGSMLNPSDATEIHFSYKFSEYIVYCVGLSDNLKPTFDMDMWIAPFSPGIWMLLAILVLGSALLASYFCPSKFVYDECILSLTAFIGQSLPDRVSKNRKTTYILIWCGILLLGLYQNDVLSVLVTQQPPKTFESLKKLLDAGYKILSLSHDANKYKLDFEISGLSDNLLESFHLFNESEYDTWNDNAIIADYLGIKKDKKYCYPVQDTFLEGAKIKIASDIGFAGGPTNKKCLHVPQPLATSQAFWLIYTTNKHWLVKTLDRFVEAGLSNKWDDWSVTRYRVMYRHFPEVYTQQVFIVLNSIDLAMLLVIFLMFAGLLLLASAVFFVEVCIGCCDNEDLGNLGNPVFRFGYVLIQIVKYHQVTLRNSR